MTISRILARSPEAIEREIEALENECEADLAVAKKTYPANCIRLDIARVQRDVYTLAIGLQELLQLTERADGAIEEILYIARRYKARQDIMESCQANHYRLLKGILKRLEMTDPLAINDTPPASDPAA